MKRIKTKIGKREYYIQDNAPDLIFHGVERQITHIKEYGKKVDVTYYNYLTGEYESMTYARDIFQQLVGMFLTEPTPDHGIIVDADVIVVNMVANEATEEIL